MSLLFDDDCFEIGEIDGMQDFAEQMRNACIDKDLKKLATEVSHKITESEENLTSVVESFAIIEPKISNEVSSDETTLSYFVKTLLDTCSLPEETDSKQDKHRLTLIAFSKMIESLHSKEDGGAIFPEEVFSENDSLEPENIKTYLEKIQTLVNSRNNLIKQYGELLAVLSREKNSKGEYDRLANLDESIPLINFIRAEFENFQQRNSISTFQETSGIDFSFLDEGSSIPVDPSISVDETKLTAEGPLTDSSIEDNALDLEEPAPVSAESNPVTTDVNSAIETPTESQPDGKRADVVFAIDASGSMRPCFEQLRDSLKKFVEPFKEAGFSSLRLGLLAYSANKDRNAGKIVYRNIFLYPGNQEAIKFLYEDEAKASRMLFTSSNNLDAGIEQFKNRLDQIKCRGDENTPFALDCAADFPFESLTTTRRVIVLFTDEKLEDGVSKMDAVGNDCRTIEKIMNKIMARHISLYLYAPNSECTDIISDYPRVCVTAIADSNSCPSGTNVWNDVSVDRIMEGLGKSISSSALQSAEEPEFTKAIFGQNTWDDSSWN
ncbi:MAG: VWA domain-containing protein [Fibrobacteraceae bacterium]|nr:VWA domain-containing protein [Fibrobacteraceae bacterium]